MKVSPLSIEQECQIKQTYLNFLLKQQCCTEAKINDVQIDKYYGTYNNSIAVMMRDQFHGYAGIIWEEVVGDVKFCYYDSRRILIWKEGRFHTIQSAYEQGFLTEINLKKIASYQNII